MRKTGKKNPKLPIFSAYSSLPKGNGYPVLYVPEIIKASGQAGGFDYFKKVAAIHAKICCMLFYVAFTKPHQ